MDIVGITVLDELKKFKGFDNAIIAGGAVRDHLMKGQFKDIDVFVPMKESYIFINNIYEQCKTDKNGYYHLGELFKNVYDVRPELGGYSNKAVKFTTMNMTYISKIPVQVIGVDLPVKDFGKALVKTFDYDLNRVWYDGEVCVTKDFERDYNQGTATLRKCDNPSDIYNHIVKFQSLKKKYPHLQFKTTLKITEEGVENRQEIKTESPEEYIGEALVGGGPLDGRGNFEGGGNFAGGAGGAGGRDFAQIDFNRILREEQRAVQAARERLAAAQAAREVFPE